MGLLRDLWRKRQHSWGKDAHGQAPESVEKPPVYTQAGSQPVATTPSHYLEPVLNTEPHSIPQLDAALGTVDYTQEEDVEDILVAGALELEEDAPAPGADHVAGGDASPSASGALEAREGPSPELGYLESSDAHGRQPSPAIGEDEHQAVGQEGDATEAPACDADPGGELPGEEDGVPGGEAAVAEVEPSPGPLATMVYLTEDGEAMDEGVSVVSDSRTEEELAGELTELSRALSALEDEVAVAGPSSPRAAVAAAGGGSAGSAAAAALGASPDPSVTSGTSFGAAAGSFAKNMVKLYNDLALRLMDAKDYDQALTMLLKAEGLLSNDANWTQPAARGNGSLDLGPKPGSREEVACDAPAQERAHVATADNSTLGGIGPADSSMDESINGGCAFDVLSAKRDRLRAITFNNLGCLYKRRALPDQALGYLQRALVLEQAGGQVHNCASTHLNICASLSALKRYKEALAHAERAILLLQRQLWGPTASTFQDGMAHLTRSTAAATSIAEAATGAAKGGTGAAAAAAAAQAAEAQRKQRQLLAGVNVLAMAYHNAAVEHERLGQVREAQVSYARACDIGARFLGPRSATASALVKAKKGFLARQQRQAASAAHSARAAATAASSASSRKGPSTMQRSAAAASSSAKARQGAAKRSGVLGGVGARTGSAASISRSGSRATLPLDKAGGRPVGARTLSSAKLSERPAR